MFTLLRLLPWQRWCGAVARLRHRLAASRRAFYKWKSFSLEMLGFLATWVGAGCGDPGFAPAVRRTLRSAVAAPHGGQRRSGVRALRGRSAAQGVGANDRVLKGRSARPLTLSADEANRLLPVAARRAAGFFRPTKRTEVVWVEGESELAVGLDGMQLQFGTGLIALTLRVRCDQTGAAEVRVQLRVRRAEAPGRPVRRGAAPPARPRADRRDLGRCAGGLRLAVRARARLGPRQRDRQGRARQPARAGRDGGDAASARDRADGAAPLQRLFGLTAAVKR